LADGKKRVLAEALKQATLKQATLSPVIDHRSSVVGRRSRPDFPFLIFPDLFETKG
jgi:hypothetical protein